MNTHLNRMLFSRAFVKCVGHVWCFLQVVYQWQLMRNLLKHRW